jgi:hypothetical protein
MLEAITAENAHLPHKFPLANGGYTPLKQRSNIRFGR